MQPSADTYGCGGAVRADDGSYPTHTVSDLYYAANTTLLAGENLSNRNVTFEFLDAPRAGASLTAGGGGRPRRAGAPAAAAGRNLTARRLIRNKHLDHALA